MNTASCSSEDTENSSHKVDLLFLWAFAISEKIHTRKQTASVFGKLLGVFGYDSVVDVRRNAFIVRTFLCRYCPGLYCGNAVLNTRITFSYSELESLVFIYLSLRSVHPNLKMSTD